MKNSLINRVQNSFIGQEIARAGKVLTYSPKHRYSTLATALFLGSSLACGDGIVDPNPPVNYAPQSTLNVTPVPLSSIRVNYSCTDQNGQEDIVDSYVFINSDTIRTKSLDSTFAMQPGTHIIGSD